MCDSGAEPNGLRGCPGIRSKTQNQLSPHTFTVWAPPMAQTEAPPSLSSGPKLEEPTGNTTTDNRPTMMSMKEGGEPSPNCVKLQCENDACPRSLASHQSHVASGGGIFSSSAAFLLSLAESVIHEALAALPVAALMGGMILLHDAMRPCPKVSCPNLVNLFMSLSIFAARRHHMVSPASTRGSELDCWSLHH